MKTASLDAYLENHEITFVGTFSRDRMVQPWFEAFMKMTLPRNKIRLLIFDNSMSKTLHSLLQEKCDLVSPELAGCELHISERRGGSTILGEDNDNFEKSKLKPIWEMWKELKDLVKTEIFFLIEDDTIAPVDAFETLVSDLLDLENAGFVTGIETGRAMFEWQKVRLGVHWMYREENKIVKRISCPPEMQGINKIDGSGVYCFACWTEVYKEAFGNMDQWVSQVPFFAMDNILTNNIKLNGHELYADFNIWCDHLHQTGGHLFPYNKKQAVQMADLWIPEFNNYAQGVEIKKP